MDSEAHSESHNDKLILRSVGPEYLKQYNDLLRYVFQVTERDIQEGGYADDELIHAKQPILRDAAVFGWFNEYDELISQIAIYPLKINIHGRVFEMGGVTGVGTYPEYAGRGLMISLIKKALEDMRNKGQWISLLYPYSIPYYRRKGWEIISDHMTYTIKDTQIPKSAPVPGYVERTTVDEPNVIRVYEKYSLITHGAMIRNNLAWEEYWRWENEEERIAAIYYNERDEEEGYLFYWISDDIFHIKEAVYLSQNARKALWNFIAAHDSMIDSVQGHQYKNEPISFLLDDGDIEEEISPYVMARIVDVKEFLLEYPFASPGNTFHFVVTDPLAEWNNGVFAVRWEQGRVVVSNLPAGSPVRLDIQTLTTMLMSYKRPSYLSRIERLQTDPATLSMLERIIPSEAPCFSDYF
jgi:predicted acetyltransferase